MLFGNFGYYDAWAFSSASKLLCKAIESNRRAGTFILAAAVVAGGFIIYKKVDVVNQKVNGMIESLKK